MLSIVTIMKTYGKGEKRVEALKGLSLEIPTGQVVGLVGPNGAGKTTLLKIILGLSHADRGRVLFMGHERTESDKSLIGYLPENPQFLKNISAREFLAFSLRLAGRDFSWKKVDEILSKVDLLGDGGRPIRTLSKGMRQRIGLAQALIHEPLLLVLDEPMSGLDPGGREMVKDVLRSYVSKDRSILFSSHELNDVEDICNRVLWVEKGLLRLDAPIIEIQKQSDFEIHWQKNGRVRVQYAEDEAELWLLIDEIRVSSGHLLRIQRRLSKRIESLLEIGRAG